MAEIPDVNAIFRAYLVTQPEVTRLVGTRIYCPRLPENATLPAIGYFVRGGPSGNPHIPPLLTPSFQVDCWADSLPRAREVYRAVYSALQGIQDVIITVGGINYRILSAREEVQGQDLIENEIPNYSRVLTFFEVQIC
ncbi:MAG: hypothetical protein DDT23_00011 [candidate division WS2 bacterium]|nr:hypothetical protein [Candidatus Lithacetigena glycinireducens]